MAHGPSVLVGAGAVGLEGISGPLVSPVWYLQEHGGAAAARDAAGGPSCRCQEQLRTGQQLCVRGHVGCHPGGIVGQFKVLGSVGAEQT